MLWKLKASQRKAFERKVLKANTPASVNETASEANASGVLCMSIEKLREIDEEQAECARKGHARIVLSGKMWTEEPTGANVIQKAENLLNACVKLPGWLDGLLRACEFCASLETDNAVLAMTVQMPNIHEDDLKCMVHTAERMGGGGSHHFKLWLFMSNHLVPRDRSLPRGVLRDVVDLALDLPVLKNALLFAAQLCPTDKMRGHVCNWVSCADVREMRARKDFKEVSRIANAMLQTASDGLKNSSSEKQLVAYMNMLARTGRHLLKKKHADFDEYTGLDHIEKAWKEDLVDNGKVPAQGAAGEGQSKLGEKQSKCLKVVHYAPDGSLYDPKRELADAGLSEGVYVQGKKFENCTKCSVENAWDCGETQCPAKQFEMRTGWVTKLSDANMTITLVSSTAAVQKIVITYDQYKSHWKLQHDKEAIQDKGIMANWQAWQSHRSTSVWGLS